MTSEKSSFSFNPFHDIKAILKRKSMHLPSRPQADHPQLGGDQTSGCEDQLFVKAMEGVTPITRDNYVEKTSQVQLPEGTRRQEDAEALSRLTDLVRYGTGFNVCDTPEYVEGTGYHVHPIIARRLHEGEFSMQAHLDLHGFVAEDAKTAFDEFLKRAVTDGKRGVLIVHGRGLSSPTEPVLKKKVIDWLTRGPWRKWVVAYSSARPCDGGAGATYVLLRQRPVPKRFRRSRGLKLE